MKTTNLPTLKIHKLSQAQYERELAAGRIDGNAIYLTPDEDIDLSGYASIIDVDEKIGSHNTSASAHNDIRTSINEVSNRLDRVVTVPVVSASNNGQFLRVVNGQWTATTVANAEEARF